MFNVLPVFCQFFALQLYEFEYGCTCTRRDPTSIDTHILQYRYVLLVPYARSTDGAPLTLVVSLFSMAQSSLSFPPLLDAQKWKGASQGRSFPGSQVTWKKQLAPRPLARTPDEQTMHELLEACGPRFDLLQQATQLPKDAVRRDGSWPPPPAPTTTRTRSFPGGPTLGMPLYSSVWGDKPLPNFSVWDYCKRVGHAPPPNSLPAPQISDLKSWFATYGHPKPNAPPGVRSEFASTNKSVPHSQGQPSAQVRLYRGRVLR